MRHGESTANHERRWVSHPSSSISGFGLTDLGRQQVKESVSAEIGNGNLSRDCIIFSSDFRRARESAEIARELLAVEEVLVDIRLRERGCGEMENRVLGPDEAASIIESVTLSDQKNPFGTPFELESSVNVMERATSFIEELERKVTSRTILLVCHFDFLRITLSAISKLSPGESYVFGHINNGAIYHLNKFLGTAQTQNCMKI